jgi:hypothetical protein
LADADRRAVARPAGTIRTTRAATRYDKLIERFAAFVILATIRIWISFVHAA